MKNRWANWKHPTRCTTFSWGTFLYLHAVRTWLPLDHAWNFLDLISRKQPGLAGHPGCSSADPRVIECTAQHSTAHRLYSLEPVPAAPQRTTWLAPNFDHAPTRLGLKPCRSRAASPKFMGRICGPTGPSKVRFFLSSLKRSSTNKFPKKNRE